MTQRDPGETWAAWLREQFDRHPVVRRPADLVRAGGKKPNGRPVIDASSVTQWLRGRRPSFELAVATGEAFGKPADEALEAAGYVTAAKIDIVNPSDHLHIDYQAEDPVRDAIERAPKLGPEGRERVLNVYDFEVDRETRVRNTG